MAENMQQVAARINTALREQYGLDHDVVEVIRHDDYEAVHLIDSDDIMAMSNFVITIEHLCEGFAAQDKRTPGQLRLF